MLITYLFLDLGLRFAHRRWEDARGEVHRNSTGFSQRRGRLRSVFEDRLLSLLLLRFTLRRLRSVRFNLWEKSASLTWKSTAYMLLYGLSALNALVLFELFHLLADPIAFVLLDRIDSIPFGFFELEDEQRTSSILLPARSVRDLHLLSDGFAFVLVQ